VPDVKLGLFAILSIHILNVENFKFCLFWKNQIMKHRKREPQSFLVSYKIA